MPCVAGYEEAAQALSPACLGNPTLHNDELACLSPRYQHHDAQVKIGSPKVIRTKDCKSRADFRCCNILASITHPAYPTPCRHHSLRHNHHDPSITMTSSAPAPKNK
jgi:hypothetical protein